LHSPKRALAVLLSAFCLGNLFVTFARSGIPYDLSGRVASIVINSEKDPGIDDVWLVRVDGRDPVHLDTRVAAQLEEGEEVVKRPFGLTIGRADAVDVRLSPSRDFWGMIPALLVLSLSVFLLERRRKGAPGGAPVDDLASSTISTSVRRRGDP
jgi:hypothetical protein